VTLSAYRTRTSWANIVISPFPGGRRMGIGVYVDNHAATLRLRGKAKCELWGEKQPGAGAADKGNSIAPHE
jgi:hypothetical protein